MGPSSFCIDSRQFEVPLVVGNLLKNLHLILQEICTKITSQSYDQEAGRSMVKCTYLYFFEHGVLLVSVHLDVVNDGHGDVGRLGGCQCLFEAREEPLDLQTVSMDSI